MDVITRAIEKKQHICDDSILQEQTWEQFETCATGKKLFLFGTGAVLDYFLIYCCQHTEIFGVVDNDKKKQGQSLGWVCPQAWQSVYDKLVIQSPEVLLHYKPEDIVVLIASTGNYREISGQLKSMGVENYFVLLILEANERKYSTVERRSNSEFIEDYVKQCCELPIVTNKIVMSYGGYGGHTKAITRQLLKKRKDLDIVWLVYEENTEVPDGVRIVPEKNWKRYVYELETAAIWLFDITVQPYITKRPEQFYVQLKHWSSITLKKFYLDDVSSCTSASIAEWITNNGRMMDYIFSGSELDEASCRSGFAFGGKFVRVGSARSDVLFDSTVKDRVYKAFNLPANARVLMYAPTYRIKEFTETKSLQVSLDLEKLQDTLEEVYGGEWYIWVRLHPWLNFEKSNLTENDKILNAGDYPDSEELVAACDMMITDYSSIMFEAAFVRKPVFLYAPDRSVYVDGERGLLINYDTLPFPIAESNEALFHCISNFDREAYEESVTAFLEHYGVHEDGHASERAAAAIEELMRTGTIMPKITILMPSLNVRKYIIPCVESVLGQTLQDIEILAIDAGSTDGTLELLEEYAARDARLRVIRADRKSYGYQMNLGLEQARGEYIGVVETDDYIVSDMYERLYELAEEQKLDFVKGGFALFVELENGLQWHSDAGAGCVELPYVGKVVTSTRMPELCRQDFYLWAGIYRRELLETVRLNESPGAAFQDIGFLFQVLKRAERAMYLTDTMYYYRQTKGNSSQSKKGFGYLLQEYDYLRKLYPDMEKAWLQGYYEKMFCQIRGRFQRMAMTGSYWQETGADVKLLVDRLKQAVAAGDFALTALGEDDRMLYDMLQQSGEKLFQYYYEQLMDKWSSCKELFKAVGDREAVVFGCGRYGSFTQALLECYRPGQMVAFCDNNAEKWNENLQGLLILSPAEAVKRYPRAVYVVANLHHAEKICEQLHDMGVDTEQLYVYQPMQHWQMFLLEEM